MKLSDLLIGIDYKIIYPKLSTDAGGQGHPPLQTGRPMGRPLQNFEITHLSCDSRDTSPDTLLICFKGRTADCHDFAPSTNAAALIVERPLDTDKVQILVSDARHAMGIIAGNFYGNPIKSMKLVCITGTNGKTTTSYILRSIFESAGIKSGLIGTTAYYVGEEKRPSDLTTPDPITLHKLFFDMANAGCKVVVMELSAHAIALKKMAGITADITILTNITQDHLDFFHTFDEYKTTKQSFFAEPFTRLAVLNIDDTAGQEIYQKAKIPMATYGTENPSEVFGINFSMSPEGIKYVLNLYDQLYEIEFSLAGKFNMYNTMAAATAARFLGMPIEIIAQGIKDLKRVEGRCDAVCLASGATAIIDYAHTPDGVESILKALNEIKTDRLITVFGCGGDRDKQKRPLMGQAATKFSDLTIITSDNPRSEPPEKIIDDIISGIAEDTTYMRQADRKEAILLALKNAKKGDIVAILGKGAEETQELKDGKIHFSDYQVVKEANG